MAISDELPGVEVAVTVGGNDLKEYRDEDLEEEEGTTTRYIEAVSGQQFAIRMKVPRRFQFVADTLRFRTYIDGNYIGGVNVYAADCRHGPHTITRTRCHVSAREARKLEFSGLETGKSSLKHL